MFTLAPATRWGYFVYPIGLLGWLVLTRPPSVVAVAGPGQRGVAGVAVSRCRVDL
jgi:DNA-binding transcriptional MocR family regulator